MSYSPILKQRQQVNQAAVAKAAGVSRSTVAFALNERLSSRVRTETRLHILKTAERLGYRPHRYAQILRAGRSRMIGLLHHMGMVQTVIERVTYASVAIQEAGYQPYAIDTVGFQGFDSLPLNLMFDARVDGLLVSGPHEGLYKSLEGSGVPTVLLMPSGRQTSLPSVASDIVQGMRDLTRHALHRGHRRLVHAVPLVGTPKINGVPVASDRERGFSEAIHAAGGRCVRFDDLAKAKSSYQRLMKEDGGMVGCIVSIPVVTPDFDPYQPGCTAFQTLLDLGPLPDIVFFQNDDWALGALSVCRKNGIRVPEDLSIAGFDNTAAGRISSVPLTTVEQPCQAVAEAAVSLLLRLVNGETLSPEERCVRIACTPIIRESCGANAGTDNE
ncbi:MAG: LacI family DNA-binding transcriptional regulator [Phycisphaerae bacterium]|jgi:LacI family transcriptional regulator